MSSIRLNKYDTLKGVLILLVILGHLIAAHVGTVFSKIAVFGIYAFHMPLFMTLTGKFARFKPLDALLYLLLFGLFDAWFIGVTAVFYLLLPLFARIKSEKGQIAIVLGGIVAGLLFGFIPLSLHEAVTRCVTFLPYFLIGYYNLLEKRPIKHTKLIGVLLILFTAFPLPLLCQNVPVPLYMCDGYGNHFIWHRIIAYLVGIAWTWWLLTVTTNKKVPVFTKMGQYTLWVYLLHEFTMPLMFKMMAYINALVGQTLFTTQLAVSILWFFLLWIPAIALQTGTQWLMKKWKPVNQKLAAKCMPKRDSNE